MVLGMDEWFFNFSQLGVRNLDEKALATVPNPQLEYTIHGFIKGCEITSILGGLIVHPIYRIYLHRTLKPENRTPNSSKVIRAACRKLQGRFLLAGMSMGPLLALTDLYFSNVPEMNLKQQCYEMRIDTNQMIIDRCAMVCGFVGWYWRRFQGAVDGINIGIAYGIACNTVLRKYTDPLLKDKIKPEQRLAHITEAEETKTALERFWFTQEKEAREAYQKANAQVEKES
ncbi:hypothetical protein WR25_01766 [Diploscapter pachys]|uniref:Uncharacterized protein n=1 Tax=Diploscapter pachys TaxID=2018661 RepID=A0A2A2JI52_9BILA|nr:hypothetical protein WR25_01766 [Diploscapter pachys]